MSESPENGAHGAEAHEAEPLGVGCVVRLFWLVGGPLGVVFSGVILARHEGVNAIIPIVVLWSSALATIALRYLDIKKLQGQTSDGQAATMQHFRRHATTIATATAVLFALALVVRGL